MFDQVLIMRTRKSTKINLVNLSCNLKHTTHCLRKALLFIIKVNLKIMSPYKIGYWREATFRGLATTAFLKISESGK